jgi:hypothetical protein
MSSVINGKDCQKTESSPSHPQNLRTAFSPPDGGSEYTALAYEPS